MRLSLAFALILTPVAASAQTYYPQPATTTFPTPMPNTSLSPLYGQQADQRSRELNHSVINSWRTLYAIGDKARASVKPPPEENEPPPPPQPLVPR